MYTQRKHSNLWSSSQPLANPGKGWCTATCVLEKVSVIKITQELHYDHQPLIKKWMKHKIQACRTCFLCDGCFSCVVQLITWVSGFNILYKIKLETVPFHFLYFEILYKVLALAVPWTFERTHLWNQLGTETSNCFLSSILLVHILQIFK